MFRGSTVVTMVFNANAAFSNSSILKAVQSGMLLHGLTKALTGGRSGSPAIPDNVADWSSRLMVSPV